jgi:PAS domain S-box-containing protein
MSGMMPWKWDMKDEDKDKEQLIAELKRLRRRMMKLKISEIRYKRAKKILKKAREKYKAAFEHAKDPILWIDSKSGLIINSNKSAEFFWEKTRAELVGHHQLTLHPKEEAEYYLQAFKIQTDERYNFAYSEEKGFSYEAEIVTKSGKVIPVHITASVSVIGKKQVIQEVFRDITKYKQSEDMLKESLMFSERLMDTMPYLIFCKDKEGVYRSCNTAFSKFVGIHKPRIIGKTDSEIFPKEFGEQFHSKDKAAFESGKPKSFEEWVTYPNGRKVLLDTLRSVYHDAEGEVIGVIGISRDVTESKQIAEAIKKADITNRKNIMEAFKKATKNLMVAQQQLKMKNTRLNQTLEEVEEINEKIMASIRYAKVIQTSLLPNLDGSNIYLPDSFVIWLPKDVVGGDIFFKDLFTDPDSCSGFIFAVIDCTGHGVPGAFMTMIASSGLRRIIKDEGCRNPAEILKQLNFIVKTSLQQDKEETLSDDGLDAAICFVELPSKGDPSMVKQQLAAGDCPLINDDCSLKLTFQ